MLHFMWNGILISGLPGTGKTQLIKEIASELGLPVISVNLLEWSEICFASNYFEDCFSKAKQCSPSVLLIDEVDTLCQCGSDKTGGIFTNKIIKVFQELKEMKKPVILVGTTNRLDSLPKQIRCGSRFDKEIILSLPESEIRSKILSQMLEGVNHSLTEEDKVVLGERALGFTAADLESAVGIGWQRAVAKWKEELPHKRELCLAAEDVAEAITSVVPSFLRKHYSVVSKVHWSHIFGYDSAKEKLQNACRAGSMKGVLLFGPPGCAKTMLARAVATETRFTFFPIKASELLSKYVGETERSLCAVFERATHAAPSLLFLDEVDSLCAARSDRGSGAAVVPELLSLLRESRAAGKLLVVGATNRPQAVDEALLSPGCFELLLHIDLPDCVSRCALWNGMLQGVPSHHIRIAELCEKTEGFSCAEICSAYQRAAFLLLEMVQESKEEREAKLTQDLIVKAISSMSPRSSKALLADMESFKSSHYKAN